MRDWARELIDSMRGVCELLDQGDAQRPYTAALELQAAKIDDPALTPSARTLAELRVNGRVVRAARAAYVARAQGVFSAICIRRTNSVSRSLRPRPRESLEKQAEIEASDNLTFDQFLANYFRRRVVGTAAIIRRDWRPSRTTLRALAATIVATA